MVKHLDYAPVNTKTIRPFHIFLIFSGLGLAYFFYFFHDIGNISIFVWDEWIYSNAARVYLTGLKPFPNPEHPPFGKELIALGIYLFGDNPAGWRIFPVLFGSVTCTLVSYFIFQWSKRLGVALFVAVLLFLDPLLVVHFRLAMLDSILAGLLVLAVLLTYQFFTRREGGLWLVYLLAVVLGLALATKLLTIVIIPILWGFVLFRLYRNHEGFWRTLHLSLVLTLLPLLVFIGTYLVLGYDLGEVYRNVIFMFAFNKTHQGPAPFFNRWFEWLYLGNPVPYHFSRVANGQAVAILATGNFVLWIAAEIALIYSLIRLWCRPEIWMLATIVGLQFLLYMQKRTTYLHYMVEILPFLYIFLGIAIADLFERYGRKYRRVLQIDLGLFAVGALVVFLNNWPFYWGKPVAYEKAEKISAWVKYYFPNDPNVTVPPK